MSEELVLLREYAKSLGLVGKSLDEEDMLQLRVELTEADEMGLAKWVGRLSGPKELEEYLGEE